jgi:nucleotide-binding universal stress UspA family protein
MKVLVPTDFTATAASGLKYALSFISNYGDGEIIAFHAVEGENQRANAEQQLQEFCDIPLPSGVRLTQCITAGDYNIEIGKQASSLGCTLIIMATKGATGIQKLIGSHAMKVVSQSNIPHIITQREVYNDEVLDRIAVPITLEREDKKILHTVTAIAKPLNASVVLIYEDKDDEFLAATIHRNLNFAKRFLRNSGINTQSIDVGNEISFDEAIIKYAAAHRCDLIATVNHHNDGILNLFGANFDQNLLENSAHIPILTVDARNQEHVTDIFMTTS